MTGPTTLATLADLARFADAFLAAHPGGGAFGLTGDLGAGKTTFVRACVEAIARRGGRPAPRVTSPSFVIHQSYADLSPPIDHFDLYRLDRADEAALADLGYPETRERCRTTRGFCFVEWPERAVSSSDLALDATLEFHLAADGVRRVNIRA